MNKFYKKNNPSKIPTFEADKNIYLHKIAKIATRSTFLFLILGTIGLSAASEVEVKQKIGPLRFEIEKQVTKEWQKEKIKPASKSDDATFLRRIYLDLVGTVPTVEEVKKFLDEKNETKRTNLIKKLLEDPRFYLQQATLWDLIMFGRNPPNQEATRNRTEFKQWLVNKFTKNEPFDHLVRDLLLAEQEGSELFYVQYSNKPEDLTEAFSRIFLGTQVHCARCHDHPNNELLQKDFYGLAGFFVRLVSMDQGQTGTGEKQSRKYKIGEKSTGEVLFSGNTKELKPGKKGEPVKPKFLNGKTLEEPELPTNFKEPEFKSGTKSAPKPQFSRKEKLVEWLINPNNPYFAKAVVNRIWSQFLGRGIVHPVDNFGTDSKPILPDLLQTLTQQFIDHKYDIKWLIQELVSSEIYQLASSGESKEALPKVFERARIRPLSAEELAAVMKTVNNDPNYKGDNVTSEYFRRYFGDPFNGQGDFQGSLGEHLFLNNSQNVRSFITRKKGNLADSIILSTDPWETRVDNMFLAVLTRLPKKKEQEKFVAYLKSDSKTENLVEEAIWVLMNMSEFRFNH